MSGEFCDCQPCNQLRRFISEKITDGARDGSVAIIVLTRSEKAPVRKVTFWYCPFCGTRLHDNKDVIEWIQSLRRV